MRLGGRLVMKLESIFETYGANDYLDMNSGLIYKLSMLDKKNDIREFVSVPVYQNGELYGDATMCNPYFKPFNVTVTSKEPEESYAKLKELFSNLPDQERYNLIGIKNNDVLSVQVGEYLVRLRPVREYGDKVFQVFVTSDTYRGKFSIRDKYWQVFPEGLGRFL